MSEAKTDFIEKHGSGKFVGQPISRVDGPDKVTGRAKYAAEHAAEDLLFGFVVSGQITKGKIKSIDETETRKITGVVDVITHANRPSTAWFNYKYADQDAAPGEHFRVLKDEEILYAGQPIGLVVAKSWEEARLGAELLKIDYEVDPVFVTDLQIAKKDAYEPRQKKSGFEKPKSRGDAKAAYDKAEKRIEAEYIHEPETHNAMEMFASTVVYDKKEKSFEIFDKTQGTQNVQAYITKVFGLSSDKVKVQTPYMGGGFGSGLRPQYHVVLAMMASLKLERSVRVVLTRQQMFSFGHRPAAIMNVKLGANASGELQAIEHTVVCETSRFETYTEGIVNWAGMLYKCENVELKHELAQLDQFTPLDMRAPGATTGLFALESAMDELSYELKMDPVELRKKNYTDKDQMHRDRPWTSKELLACYEQGAAKFGWSKRKPAPRSMRDGRKLIGYGMATGMWDAFHQQSKAEAELNQDGTLTIRSAVTDIGTGTYTILAQLAGEALGLELKDVHVKIGDSTFAAAPLQGGSWTASTLGSAAQDACRNVAEKLFKLAQNLPDSPFKDLKFEDVRFENASMKAMTDGARTLKLTKIMALSETKSLKEEGKTGPNMLTMPLKSKNTHSAVFVEVSVDEDYGMIEVTRVVAAIAAGRILNPKTARSQILGGVVWGISQALHEENAIDHRLGRTMNHNFAEYHIPVNRDIGDIEVIFVHEEDKEASPIGVKGLGEIGIVGTAAAVANAVYHATGVRVRDLPIQLNDVLESRT